MCDSWKLLILCALILILSRGLKGNLNAVTCPLKVTLFELDSASGFFNIPLMGELAPNTAGHASSQDEEMLVATWSSWQLSPALQLPSKKLEQTIPGYSFPVDVWGLRRALGDLDRFRLFGVFSLHCHETAGAAGIGSATSGSASGKRSKNLRVWRCLQSSYEKGQSGLDLS